MAIPLDPPVYHFSLLAGQVYNDPPDFGAVNSAARAKLYDGGTVLAIRGTDDLAALKADLEAFTTRTTGLGLLHEGIYEAWEEIEARVLALDPSPRVLVGHSEGAALALMAAGSLIRAGKLPQAVYAFEPPRICGDGVLRDLLVGSGSLIYLTRNGNDLIPMIPTFLDHPAPLVAVGKALQPLPNLEDHLIVHVQQAFAPAAPA